MAAQEQPVGTDLGAGTEQKRLLIVDDEQVFLLSLGDGLQARYPKLEVLTAANGREALETLDSNRIDVVLTDLRMPEMDGFELLAAMSRKHWSVPVIVMTAFGSPEIEDRVRRSGAMQLLDKPLAFERVTRAIETALESGVHSHVRGIALPAFLQLRELEQKTCTVVVAAAGGVARLYCRDGTLLDAEAGELRGLEAAYEAVCWQDCQIEINSSCPVTRRTIRTPLHQVLLEAHRLRDERARKQRNVQPAPPAEPPPAEPPPAELPPAELPPAEPPLTGIMARLAEVPGVDGVLLIDRDSTVVASHGWPSSVSRTRLGELLRYATSNVIDMGNELQIAELHELFVEYEEALILCRPAGRGLVALLSTDHSKIGSVRHKTRLLIAEIATQLPAGE